MEDETIKKESEAGEDKTIKEFTAPAESGAATFTTDDNHPGIGWLFGVSINHFTKYTREELIAEGYSPEQVDEAARVLAECKPPQKIGGNSEALKAEQAKAKAKYEASLQSGK